MINLISFIIFKLIMDESERLHKANRQYSHWSRSPFPPGDPDNKVSSLRLPHSTSIGRSLQACGSLGHHSLCEGTRRQDEERADEHGAQSFLGCHNQ